MKISNDIKSLIEDDVKHLTDAFLTGEISVDSISLADKFNPDLLHKFSADIIKYQLEKKILSSLIPYLSTMKWLSLQEACIYARKSRNTILELIKTGKIYGTKPEGMGDYVVDRESIDKFFDIERNERRLHLTNIRRAL